MKYPNIKATEKAPSEDDYLIEVIMPCGFKFYIEVPKGNDKYFKLKALINEGDVVGLNFVTRGHYM